MSNEFEQVNPEVVENTEVKAPVEKDFLLDDGSISSRSAYIRQEFKKDRSRGDIAKELGVAYYIVYSATTNMFNAAHPEGGSGVGSARGEMIAITETTREYVADRDAYAGEETLVNIPRSAYMRELVKGGMSRGEVAKLLDCPYATVYASTKDEEGGTTKATRVVLIHPETGEEINRADYIRELFEAGMTRKEIAVHITKMTGDLCDYSTVWAATKPPKAEVEAVEAVEATEEVEEVEEDTEYDETDEDIDEDAD